MKTSNKVLLIDWEQIKYNKESKVIKGYEKVVFVKGPKSIKTDVENIRKNFIKENVEVEFLMSPVDLPNSADFAISAEAAIYVKEGFEVDIVSKDKAFQVVAGYLNQKHQRESVKCLSDLEQTKPAHSDVESLLLKVLKALRKAVTNSTLPKTLDKLKTFMSSIVRNQITPDFCINELCNKKLIEIENNKISYNIVI